MRIKGVTYCFLLLAIAADWGGVALHSWGHDVGEPELEKLPVWTQCCEDGDCFPEHVKTLGKEPGKIDVEIDGEKTAVDTDKFSPVPSHRTWVCYIRPGGPIKNENIRCILHPQSGGTT